MTGWLAGRGSWRTLLWAGLCLALFAPPGSARAAAPEYFTVRPDIRRCIAPLCGGFFIDPVNRRSMRCADGERREECYVAEIDLGALGPDATLSVSPLDPPPVVRGTLEDLKFEQVVLHVLVASELWEPATGAQSDGRFVRLSDSGIRCITSPCPSTQAQVLNRRARRLVEEVDLSGVKLDEAALEEAPQRIGSDEGLVAAGRFFWRRLGRGQAVRGFAASEVYFPFASETSCRADEDCLDTEWCRPTEYDASACVPFAGPGESCEGFVLPWFRERCEPGLQCVPSEPTGDVPGTCASCNVDGKPVQAGEAFPAGDGCNTCACLPGGRVVCTEIACGPLPRPEL